MLANFSFKKGLLTVIILFRKMDRGNKPGPRFTKENGYLNKDKDPKKPKDDKKKDDDKKDGAGGRGTRDASTQT
jgi:hypothetical protein